MPHLTALNVYPVFERSIRAREKTLTIKLGDKRADYEIGDELDLTCGWDAMTAQKLARIRVTEVKNMSLWRVDKKSLEGDVIRVEDVQSMCIFLSLIYHYDVTPSTWVTLIRWEYIEKEEC